MRRPRLVIAGTHSGVGKTTVTLALLSALRGKGVSCSHSRPARISSIRVTTKWRPAGLHAIWTGWMLGEAVNRGIFARASADADLSIIEGMMGLFDGSSSTQDSGSTAELAKQLKAPVLLVIDGSAMARSAAAMASGYARFDPAVRVAGVLFNRVKSEGHYRLLRDAVTSATDLEVVGHLEPDSTVTSPTGILGFGRRSKRGAQGLCSVGRVRGKDDRSGPGCLVGRIG